MLNRLGTLVWESGGLPLIIELLDQGVVDRQLLASVLRTSGIEGEQLLIKLMKYHQNEKVRASAAAVLPYRLPENAMKTFIKIQLSPNEQIKNANKRKENGVRLQQHSCVLINELGNI